MTALPILVKDAARALLRALQMRLTEHSVSLGHWTFLRVLWESDGLTQRELSERAGVMEPTTFSALKAMEKLGYVRRRQLPGNKKKVFVFLTAKGRLLKSKLVPLAEEVNEIAVRGVKPTEITALRQVLLTIIENLACDEMQSSSKVRRIPSTRELAALVERRHRPHGASRAVRPRTKRAVRRPKGNQRSRAIATPP